MSQSALTVDTGQPTDVFPGRLVTWMHVPRGGYGFAQPVAARVVRYWLRPSTRVEIEVVTAAGRTVRKRVDVSSLRHHTRMTSPSTKLVDDVEQEA
jgi:hypothetical protein